MSPRQTIILEVSQTQPGRGTTPLADLAVIPSEIQYSIWTRDLQAKIHNVGSKTAKKFRVTFYQGFVTDSSQGVRRNGRAQVAQPDLKNKAVPRDGSSANVQSREKIGEVTVPSLSWPMDLAAKTLTVATPFVPTHSQVRITVVVDAIGAIPELCETNNRATRSFEFDLDEIRAPRNRVGEIGGNVSGEIERGLR